MTCLRDDFGFLFVVLGIQYVVGDSFALQKLREKLGFFDRNRADQNRLPLGVALLDLGNDGAELSCLRFVDDVGVVDSDDGLVRRNFDHVKVVDAAELLFLRKRRAGHAGELAVKPEEILEGDGGKRFVLARDRNALLGLDCLMQTLVVSPTVHQTTRKLVDNDDLPVFDDVVDVLFHQPTRLHRLIDVVRKRGIFRIGKVLHAEELFGFFDARLRQRHRAVLFVDHVVAVVLVLKLLVVGGGEDLLFEPGDKIVRHLVELGRFLALAGDDQRRSGFINQNGVDLVDDGKGMSALDHFLFINRHIVAQVVEAQLVVGAVGDVRGIGGAPLGRGEVVDNQTHRKPQEAVDLAHPL